VFDLLDVFDFFVDYYCVIFGEYFDWDEYCEVMLC